MMRAQVLNPEVATVRSQGIEVETTLRCLVTDVELQGHIIDSLILSKVLDEVLSRGGSYVVRDLRIGYRPVDPSYVRLEVRAGTARRLQEILAAIRDHGAVPPATAGAQVKPL
jgi:hypothetical protein